MLVEVGVVAQVAATGFLLAVRHRDMNASKEAVGRLRRLRSEQPVKPADNMRTFGNAVSASFGRRQ